MAILSSKEFNDGRHGCNVEFLGTISEAAVELVRSPNSGKSPISGVLSVS